MSHREIRIIDEQNCSVPRGDVGELVVRGLGMMDGYWRNPEATAAAFRNGWYHTGDLAYFDADGRVHLAGRQKDMIRRSGENIAANEVEGVIQQHPAVALAACIAVPDTLRGEEVKAFIVLRQEHRAQPPEPEALVDFVAQRLAAFKVPRYWEYRDDLPRTASERVAKPLLRGETGGAAEYDRQPNR
jgi:crotonobetaine/carnitine-CoA ligase